MDLGLPWMVLNSKFSLGCIVDNHNRGAGGTGFGANHAKLVRIERRACYHKSSPVMRCVAMWDASYVTPGIAAMACAILIDWNQSMATVLMTALAFGPNVAVERNFARNARSGSLGKSFWNISVTIKAVLRLIVVTVLARVASGALSSSTGCLPMICLCLVREA